MLRYSIADEMPYSTGKGFSFSTRAFSGGGPLPTGFCVAKYIGKYTKFGECARLEQTLTSLVHLDLRGDVKVTARDGFLIYGDGPRGSDGRRSPGTVA